MGVDRGLKIFLGHCGHAPLYGACLTPTVTMGLSRTICEVYSSPVRILFEILCV